MDTAYEVLLHPRAKQELDKVPRPLFLKIDPVIWGLRKTPRPFGVKKLEGDLHRIRVRDWRIIYAIFDQEHRAVILRVTRRTERTYKDLH